ncbi:hypothetical protein BDW66DRAFT_153130 [Aspergillus desertorum]
MRRRPRQNPQSAATSPDVNLNPSTTSAGTSHLDTTFAAYTGMTGIPISCATDTRSITDANTAKPQGPNAILDSTIDRESTFPALMDKLTAMWPCASQLNSHEPERYDKDMDWSSNMFDLIGHQMEANLAFLEIPPGILPLNNDEASRLEGELLVITDNENGTGMPLASPRTCDSYSSVAERHLVLACHTLLLEIYVSVFGSLQRDVDHCLDSDPVGQDPAVGTASLGDMPVVLIVQLCSYILDRQHRAVSSYLSPKLEPGQREQIDVSGSPKSTAIQGVNTGPGSEVQRRLERLRQSLRI